MRHFQVLLFAIAITGCSKSNNNATYTLEYQFSVNSSAGFFITYSDSNNNLDTLSYTGTSWTKTITVKQGAGFNGAHFDILDKANVYGPPAPGVKGNAYIYLNGKNVDQVVLDFTGGIGSMNIYYPVFN